MARRLATVQHQRRLRARPLAVGDIHWTSRDVTLQPSKRSVAECNDSDHRMITIDEGLGFDTFARDRFDFGRIKLEGGADWRENAISADRLQIDSVWSMEELSRGRHHFSKTRQAQMGGAA